jgi:hypothetical protein
MVRFDSVLEISDPPEAWLPQWVNIAEKTAGLLLVAEEFISHKASVEWRENRDDTRTQWLTGHFYSPVVSRKEASDDWERISLRAAPANLDLNANGKRALFEELKKYFHEMPFEDVEIEKFRYKFSNLLYDFSHMLIYWNMINHLCPRKIIEIGSGFSLALALDTIDALGLPTTCTFIDPFLAVAEAATAPLQSRHNIVPQRIQDVGVRLFDELGHNDILFIDYSHTVKSGAEIPLQEAKGRRAERRREGLQPWPGQLPRRHPALHRCRALPQPAPHPSQQDLHHRRTGQHRSGVQPHLNIGTDPGAERSRRANL